MKILFTRFPQESAHGGAEMQTLSLMQGLIGRGHAVAFLGSCPVLFDLCRKNDIMAAELDIGKPPVTKHGAVTFTWRKRKIRKTLEAALAEFGDLDVICMLSMSEKILLTPFATKRGIKTIWIEHDRIGRWLTQNPWLKQLLRSAALATTVAVSSLTKDAFVNIGWPKDRIVDIVNGIDERRLGNGPRTIHQRLKLGCIARLSADKGVHLLLDALQELPETDLAIVGTGPQGKDIRKRVVALNTDRKRESVTLVPNVPSVGDFYRSIDALVLASPEQDPCPLAPMEAMHVGTPVLLTNLCGTAGYLRDGIDALIVPAGSVRKLREGMALLHDKELRTRLAGEGRLSAHRLFGLERMVDEYVTLFERP